MAVPVYQHTPNQWARWGADEELQELRTQLLRLSGGDLSSVLGGAFTPPADIEETDDAYIVEVELPGMKKRDIDVSLSGQVLTIAGERIEKERIGLIRRRVRSIGKFLYEVRLPEPVDDHGLAAKLEDGVLTVRVPKTATTKGQRVDVT
jgi:HSP20 family protein